MCCEPRTTVIVLSVLGLIGPAITLFIAPLISKILAIVLFSLNCIILRATASQTVEAWKIAKYCGITLMSMCVLSTVIGVLFTETIVVSAQVSGKVSSETQNFMDLIVGTSKVVIIIGGALGLAWEYWKYWAIAKCWRAAAHPAPVVSAQMQSQYVPPPQVSAQPSPVQFNINNQPVYNQTPYPEAPPAYPNAPPMEVKV